MEKNFFSTPIAIKKTTKTRTKKEQKHKKKEQKQKQNYSQTSLKISLLLVIPTFHIYYRYSSLGINFFIHKGL